ncbi:MAG: CTP synthase [candidate division WOR-3 bacterium]
MPKFVFVTGGVVSSLGKGIVTSSVGLLLKEHGLRVTALKMDPYLNVDPGTMNPYQHGEVFVTDDGAETDLDLGHYERFLNEDMTRANNLTAGQVYHRVLEKERRGDYLGGTVQVVPHLTDEIKSAIRALSDNRDVVIVEVGGTVGDIESLPFLEAIRQIRLEEGPSGALFIHVTLVPFIKVIEEMKTKPTQHSVQKLREIGIQPDMLVCRTENPLSKEAKEKIALFTSVAKEAVLEAPDVRTIYQVPLNLFQQEMDDFILDALRLTPPQLEITMGAWKELVDRIMNPEREVNIGLVGKYTGVKDSYKSILEAFVHAGAHHRTRVQVRMIESSEIERSGPQSVLSGMDGILVAPGFGERGIEGKLAAARFAREKGIPYFGICLGMQVACVEFARNVLGLSGANSTEFNPETPHPVIDILPDKRGIKEMGGTLRLGAYPAVLQDGSLAHRIYGAKSISERHRHRYEFNPDYISAFVKAGAVFSGLSPDGRLVEIMELRDHPFFIGTQFHPEFKSRPLRPHPIFREFIRAALDQRG